MGEGTMKEFFCGDLIPGCTEHYVGQTIAEIMAQVEEHALVHGITKLPPERMRAILARIRDAA